MKRTRIHPAWWLIVAIGIGLLPLITQVNSVSGQGGFRDQIALIRGALMSLGFPEPGVKETSQGASLPATATISSTMPVEFKPGVVQTFLRVDVLTAENAQSLFENDSRSYLSDRGPSGVLLPNDQSYTFNGNGEALTVGTGLAAVVAIGKSQTTTFVPTTGAQYPTGTAAGIFACGNLYIQIAQRRVSAAPIQGYNSPEERTQWTQKASLAAKDDLKAKMGALAKALLAGGGCGAPSPQQIDLTNGHIEVVQVVQDEANSVPLVAEKNTLLRLFVNVGGSPTGPVAGVDAEVRAFPPGVSGGILIKADNAPLTAPLAPNRNKLADSLNFSFPISLTIGTYPLEITLNPTRAVKETDYSNNQFTQQMVFVHQNSLRIGYVRVGYDPSGRRQYTYPTGPLDTYANFLKKVYPVAVDGVSYYYAGRTHRDRPLATITDTIDIISNLEKAYSLMKGTKPDQLVAWLPDLMDTFGVEGSGSLAANFGLPPRVSYVQDYTRPGPLEPQFVLAHEIGHNLGIFHPGTNSPPCDNGAQSKGNYWPYDVDTTTGLTATIHGVGYDWETKTLVDSAHLDLMTYCSDAPIGLAQGMWISPFHYKQLYEGNLKPKFTPEMNIEALLFSGFATRDGSSGGLDPAYRLSDYTSQLVRPGKSAFYPAIGFSMLSAPMSAAGNHCVRLSGATGPLADYCFNLEFSEHVSGAPLATQSFALAVPYMPGTIRATLLRGNKELASLTASRGAPKVQINTVSAAETWQGTHTLGWSATSADGGALTYAVLYSPDGGQSWMPIDFDFKEAQLPVDTSELPNGKQAMFRVLASDGLNTGSAEVGPITIANAGSPNSGGNPGGGSAPVPAVVPGNLGTLALVGIGGCGLLCVMVMGLALLLMVARRGSKRPTRRRPELPR
jgi:hypothetical protein